MKKLVLMTLASAALFVTAGAASAQVYYSGPGFGVHIGPRADYYDDGYYERRRYRDDRRYYREGRSYRTFNGCPPRYTVQDGVCKPYTGR